MLVEPNLAATHATVKDASKQQYTADNSLMTKDSMHNSVIRGQNGANMMIQNQNQVEMDNQVNNFIRGFNEKKSNDLASNQAMFENLYEQQFKMQAPDIKPTNKNVLFNDKQNLYHNPSNAYGINQASHYTSQQRTQLYNIGDQKKPPKTTLTGGVSGARGSSVNEQYHSTIGSSNIPGPYSI